MLNPPAGGRKPKVFYQRGYLSQTPGIIGLSRVNLDLCALCRMHELTRNVWGDPSSNDPIVRLPCQNPLRHRLLQLGDGDRQQYGEGSGALPLIATRANSRLVPRGRSTTAPSFQFRGTAFYNTLQSLNGAGDTCWINATRSRSGER